MSLTWRRFSFFERSADTERQLDDGITAISGTKSNLYAINAQGEVVSLHNSQKPDIPEARVVCLSVVMHSLIAGSSLEYNSIASNTACLQYAKLLL